MLQIGVDEVGRGSFAGDVYVCVFASHLSNKKLISIFKDQTIKDSKKLSEKGRGVIYKNLLQLKKEGVVSWEIGKKNAHYIDTYGLTKAIQESIHIAIKKLNQKENTLTASFFLDGGLYIDKKYKQKTVIRGDATIAVIACASIVAKVSRDAYMRRLSKKYPYYDFENNVGYGTKKHIRAIKKHGITEEHRLLFLKKELTKG